MLITQRTPAIDSTPRAVAPLNIVVLFTSVASTLNALKKAGDLASGLSATITLLVPQVVPYPLPLTRAPVMQEFNERRFRVIAENSPVETTVRIYLCRDKRQALHSALDPKSIVVLGAARRTWWPSAEKRLAAHLKRSGHSVVIAERN
jgi:hypothetical protein